MKKKLTILAFGLLLAVGWTSTAQAQLKRTASRPATQRLAIVPEEQDNAMTIDSQVWKGNSSRNMAPNRGHSDVYANEVSYTKDDYSRINYTWYEGTTTSSPSHSASLTDVATDPYQMYWLLRSTYLNPAIPGILWNDVFEEATTYFGVGRGWNVGTLSNPTNNIMVYFSDTYAYFKSIKLLNGQGQTVYTWSRNDGYSTVNGTLSTQTIDGTSYYHFSSTGRVYIYPSVLGNTPVEGLHIVVEGYCGRSSSDTEKSTIQSNATNYFVTQTMSVGGPYDYELWIEDRANITAPTYNAYTVFLIKLKDFNEVSQSQGWDFRTQTYVADDLINVFDSIYESIELLTDGLRVGEGTDAAGTVFAYRGVLNRFYFIGKGKTATYNAAGSRGFGPYNQGPFYVMYEEFSPTTTDSGVETPDFYQNMHAGEYYSVIHDCATVIGYQHYFSMFGKDTIVHKSVAPMVLYIPDLRSKSGSRNYEEGHKPQVGLYTIQLFAETEPSATYAQDSTYTVTLDWTSTLNDMVNNTVDQTYVIYTVTYDAQNNPIYTPLDTLVNPTDLTYSYDVPQTQASQQIHYVIMGFPTDATNNPDVQDGGIFYAYSNVDDVQIPGWFDFMVLYRERYESDFVIHEEKNYYRNWLYPTNIAENTGMTMGQLKQEWPNQTASYTLWRDNTGVAVLEVKAIGKKVYYRIKYYDETQVTTGVNDIEMPIEYQTISNN